MTIGMSTQNNQNTIYRKSRNYGCNTPLWDASVNEYWELFTQKKRICPNKVNNNQQLQLQQQQPIDPLIIAKNHGPILQNQRCPTNLNICKGQ
jgi:hypothetical protein